MIHFSLRAISPMPPRGDQGGSGEILENFPGRVARLRGMGISPSRGNESNRGIERKKSARVTCGMNLVSALGVNGLAPRE